MCTCSSFVFVKTGSSKLQPHMRHSDSSSSLASEREYITSLDLSANELKDIDALSQKCCLSGHLEHLTKLELHQNALTGFPQQLCEVESLCLLNPRDPAGHRVAIRFAWIKRTCLNRFIITSEYLECVPGAKREDTLKTSPWSGFTKSKCGFKFSTSLSLSSIVCLIRDIYSIFIEHHGTYHIGKEIRDTFKKIFKRFTRNETDITDLYNKRHHRLITPYPCSFHLSL